MFTHLHVHTEYSLLDGLCRIEHVIAQAKRLGMHSLAITDHGGMYGVIDFYTAARNAGIKPIIGCEVYVAPNERTSKNPGDKNPYHLTLLAKNNTGYRNLLALVTLANLEGFYYKPRVDKELLKKYNEGIIALSGCLQGELPRLVLESRMEDALTAADWYRNTFKDYYIEIQRHPIPELEQANKGLLDISHKLNIPVVATSDIHYVLKEDAKIHEILLCIQTNTTINDPKRMKMAGDYFYLKSPEEMAALYTDIPEAIENTEIIASQCDVEIEFSKLHLPKVEIPDNKTADEFLAELCWAGLKKRFPDVTPTLEQRLSYELDVIRQTHFPDYFLVVWDLIKFVRDNNILFGVRGSAAASLALYCLGITDIDPLEHKLVFERFLNIERREMPDIDLDFQDDRRSECLSYVTGKYGRDRVAQIITFGTLGARAAVRDVGRALGMPYSMGDRVARLIPPRPNIKLDDALNENRELYDIYNDDDAIRNLIDTSRKIEGISRHASTHAAGVVIAREPLYKYLPLQRSTKDTEQAMSTTQFPMENVARLGLLKMDFLGLANLTLLARAKKIIADNRNIDLDIKKIPIDDRATFKLLSSGETGGIFQLEGEGMRRNIKELKPSTFTDIAAMVALYRPGPMEHIPRFIRSKHGLEKIHYPHPALEAILEETYGVIVYQDQVLLIVQALAKYSLGQADIFRKAMGKKKPEVMKKEKANFINGAVANDISEEKAREVFALIEPFAGYAFNKAHAVSYARIAYETAYLKANYPVEFMTALLNIHQGNTEKVQSAVAECRRMSIAVLPPDINKSMPDFSIEKFNGNLGIRFGLAAVKNVGGAAVEPLISARDQEGEYQSIDDFCRRADLRNVNKKVLESLIKVGTFDHLATRGALLNSINQIVSISQRERQMKESGQSSMFDLWGTSVSTPLPGIALDNFEVPLKEKLAWEKELMGVYFSEHPLSSLASNLKGVVTTFCGQIKDEMVAKPVVVAGILTSCRQLQTRDGRPFVIATLEDLDGNIDITVWTETYIRTKDLWNEGEVLLVEGKVKIREDKLIINCTGASHYQSGNEPPKTDSVPENGLRYLIEISMDDSGAEDVNAERLNNIIDILSLYPGEDTVRLQIKTSTEIQQLELPPVKHNPEMISKLADIIGQSNIIVEKITQ
jgi:DNA polymerase III subunit alpha